MAHRQGIGPLGLVERVQQKAVSPPRAVPEDLPQYPFVVQAFAYVKLFAVSSLQCYAADIDRSHEQSS